MGLNCSQRGARPRLTLSTAITPGRVGGRYPSAVPHALCRGWSTDKQQQQHPQHTSPCSLGLGPSLRQPRPSPRKPCSLHHRLLLHRRWYDSDSAGGGVKLPTKRAIHRSSFPRWVARGTVCVTSAAVNIAPRTWTTNHRFSSRGEVIPVCAAASPP